MNSLKMKKEVSAAVGFLTRLVGKNKEFSQEQLELFKRTLCTLMTEKFKDHWFPEKPCKGQAYRCIRLNSRGPRDPLLEQAAKVCGFKYESLNLPVELTVWVDPDEVCCRFGEEEGSYCTVASFINNKENVPNNIEVHLKSSNQNSQESSKKVKKSKKPLEKQKKGVPSSKNYIIPPGPNSYLHTKGNVSYFDWNPAAVFSSRIARANGYLPHDLPFVRRPKKASARPIYAPDRYHWARK